MEPRTASDPADYGERMAEIYDTWYPGNPQQVMQAVDYLASHAAGGPVLELGIGTGRIAVPLAARGLAVSGIDASPLMVEKLHAKEGGGQIPVSIGDFADVDVEGGPFALVYVVFNTFYGLLTQADQVRCFRNVAARLRPGGVFAVEAFVPDVARFDRGQRVAVDSLSGPSVRFSLSEHDPTSQRVRVCDIAVGPDGVAAYPVEIRYVWPSEFDLMAQLAGLDLVGRWGGWQGQPFTTASTAHVSAWAPRPEHPV